VAQGFSPANDEHEIGGCSQAIRLFAFGTSSDAARWSVQPSSSS